MNTEFKFLILFVIGPFLLAGCGSGVDVSSSTVRQTENPPFSNLSVVKTKFGFPIIVDIRDGYIAKFLAETGVWESGVSTVLEKLVKPGDHILELGANYGYHTISLSKIIGITGSIYSYEANPHVCDILKKNKALNNLDNLTIKCVAASNKKGVVNFTVDYVNLGASFVGIDDKSSADMLEEKGFKNSKTFTVDSDLIDNNYELRGVAIDLLRMDIEGSEGVAIQGSDELLDRSPKMKIVMEWSTRQLEKFGSVSDIINNLEKKGFRFYYLIDKDSGNIIKKDRGWMMTMWDCDIVISKNEISI